jgi:hypothetical protein
MDSENNLLLVVVVALLLLIFVVSHKRRRGGLWRKHHAAKNAHHMREHLDNVAAANAIHKRDAKGGSFNPRLIQPQINEQVIDDNFIPMPDKIDYPWSANTGDYGATDILNDGGNGNLGLNFSMCSKSCCSSQYPPPFSVSPDNYVLMSDKEFLPTPYTCNNGFQDSGCACVTREQSDFMRHRGNNSSGGDL